MDRCFYFFLWLFISVGKTYSQTQSDTLYPSHSNNITLPENILDRLPAMTLPLSIAGNQFVLYGICRIAGHIRWIKNLQNNDYCLPLASAMTITEVVAAGDFQPSWNDPPYWQYMRPLIGGLVIYYSYSVGNDLGIPFLSIVPVAFLAHLGGEAMARAIDRLAASLISGQTNSPDNKTMASSLAQSSQLSLTTSIILGGLICEVADKTGFGISNPLIVFVPGFAAMESFMFKMAPLDEFHSTANLSARAKGAIIAFLATASALATCTGLNKIQQALGATTPSEDLARIISGFGAITAAGSVAIIDASARTTMGAGTLAKTVITTATVAMTATLTAKVIARFGANNGVSATPFFTRFGKASFTALTFALFSSLANYAVYELPVGKTLSDINKTLWMNFYVPLEYLNSLFR